MFYLYIWKSANNLSIGVQIGQHKKAKWWHCLLWFAGDTGQVRRIFGQSNFNSVNHLEDKSIRTIIKLPVSGETKFFLSALFKPAQSIRTYKYMYNFIIRYDIGIVIVKEN